jgi:hypothetical protein
MAVGMGEPCRVGEATSALATCRSAISASRPDHKYGKPIAEWQQIVRHRPPAKHMELVAMPKDEHGMGHGHANAVVAHTLTEKG